MRSAVIEGRNAEAFEDRANAASLVRFTTDRVIPEIGPTPDMRLLDLCSGSGILLDRLDGQVGERTAIDASNSMVKMLI